MNSSGKPPITMKEGRRTTAARRSRTPLPPVGAVDDGDGGEQADDDEGHADAEKMVAKLGGDSAMQDDGTGSRKGAHSDEGRGDSTDNAAHTVLLSIETSGRGIGGDQRGR